MVSDHDAPSLRVTAARKRVAPQRYADLQGVGRAALLTQQSDATARTRTAMSRARRGRPGFGRRQHAGGKGARSDWKLGAAFKHVLNGKAFSFSRRKEDSVAGIGLFTEAALARRTTLGYFTGQRVTAEEAARRRASGAKCIISYLDLESAAVWLDGSKSRTSPVGWLNSSRDTGKQANVDFVVDGEKLTVVTLRAVASGEELLADYSWS